jgi:formylglycine-generating enzyme required for sulfatase activity
VSLPNPIPDNPLKWDGWRKYNSPNLYERLCLDYGGNFNAEVIEENTRLLLVWWQKKLPLKNQPSNPMAQLLRQGLDEAPQFLAEARTRLLDSSERERHNIELHSQLVATAIVEFKKLLSFTLAGGQLTAESEARLIAAGESFGLKLTDMLPVIDEELTKTGNSRLLVEPIAPPPPPAPLPVEAPAPAHVPSPNAIPASTAGTMAAQAGDPFNEFRRILKMSRLCLDGEEMSDDQRDAMCNLGESLGLTGGQAEDLIDEYLEEMASMPIAPSKPAAVVARPAAPAAAVAVPARAPTAVNRPVPAPVVAARPTVAVAAAPKREVNLSPVARAEEKMKYPNFSNSLGMDMFLIPTGQFRMGSDSADAQSNEAPVSPVILTCFYMSRFTVTNAMYEQFDPTHRTKRGAWADETHPVIYVSSVEAEAFCKWLSQRDGKKYRLPSEAEWEYAARGGEVRIFPWGDRSISGNLANFADARTQFAWRDSNVDDGFAETAPVGSFPRGASPFGIEDMAGNVFEWCLDAFEAYKGREAVNPKILKNTDKRVYRGGSWKSRISSLRCCARNSNVPTYQSNDVGFRIVCDCV